MRPDPEELELDEALERAARDWAAERVQAALDGSDDPEAQALLAAERWWQRCLRPTWTSAAIDRTIADDGAP